MREHAEKILVADAAQAAGVTCEMVHVERESLPGDYRYRGVERW
jgi:hypothetical protein